MNNKIIKIIACGALLAGLSVFFIAQNVFAQYDQGCQDAYDSARETCRSTVFGCYDTCDKYDAGYYACQDECSARNRDCIEAINNQYTACTEDTNTQPPITRPAAQPVPPENQKIVDGMAYTPAFVETAPKDDDLQPKSYFGKDAPPKDAQGRLQFVVRELEGSADVQLPDGTWVVVQEGSIIPYGATIFTGYDSKATLETSSYLLIVLRPLSEMNVEQFHKDASVYYMNLKLGTGELRFKVEEGDYKTDLRPATPNSTASPAGTDFGVSYDKGTDTTIWEIYDGGLEITSTKTGEVKTIFSSYGSPIKRIKVANDGLMVETTAIPRSEWGAFVAKTKNGGSPVAWQWIAALLIIGSIGYLTYRKKDMLIKIFKK
ncbi:MAG: hypothetical protein A3C13_00715 [Candidatus Lloydbacteria bacterium RIFCSPHIGHO2_02_FULL_50_11]|nr:MAG: hypothetical protein A3C13_00715 [Candidatus Lloydbacteria bacterium RIFCSPHIGHO2_02_FULL_50_11]